MAETTDRTWTAWVCDNCGDWAEVEPGDKCEVCAEGTIQVVKCVDVALLAAERARSQGLEEALHQIAAYTDCNGEWADWHSTGTLASHVHGKARNALVRLSTAPQGGEDG